MTNTRTHRKSRSSSWTRWSRRSVLPPFAPLTLRREMKRLGLFLKAHTLTLINWRDKRLRSMSKMTHLSAPLPSVPWRTPQSWRPLDACAATDPLDALSTGRPRCARFTLEPREDAGRCAGKVKGHTASQHAINTTHLSALNNCFQLRPPFPSSVCLLTHTKVFWFFFLMDGG